MQAASHLNELTTLVEKRSQGLASDEELKRIAQLAERDLRLVSLITVTGMALGLAVVCAGGTFAFRYFVPDGPLPWITWQVAGLGGAALAALIGTVEAISSRQHYLDQMTHADNPDQ